MDASWDVSPFPRTKRNPPCSQATEGLLLARWTVELEGPDPSPSASSGGQRELGLQVHALSLHPAVMLCRDKQRMVSCAWTGSGKNVP